MQYSILPLSDDKRHIFLLDTTIDDIVIRAEIEIRYMPAPDQWVISIRDHETGEELVRMIPLICSYVRINDLLAPYRFLRNGKGLGSLFVLTNTNNPDTQDPAENTLKQFMVLWGDTYDESQLILTQ